MYSGLVSHIVTAKILYPRIISRVSSQAKPTAAISTSNATKAAAVGETSAVKAVTEPAAESSKDHILPSLGASGAIYAAVTLTALAFPNTEIALMIPPSFPIPIQWGVGGLVALDIIGVLRGWRYVERCDAGARAQCYSRTGCSTIGHILAVQCLACGTTTMVRGCGTSSGRRTLVYLRTLHGIRKCLRQRCSRPQFASWNRSQLSICHVVVIC